MADLEVTLGAKNEASEVLRQFQQDFQNAGQNIQFSLRGLGQLAGLTAVVVGVVEGAKAIANFATSSVTAFDEVNKSAIRLNETLAILPNTAGVSGDQLAKLAEQLERVTNVDQSQIVNQMAAAARRGADPGQLDEMAEAAIGLARVFDRDLGSAMRLVEQATQGNFEAFRGLIPQIDALATEDEKLAAVSKLAQTGLENKAQAARSALESSEALHVATKQLYQTVGALVVPFRDAVYKGMVLISDFINGQLNPDFDTFEQTIQRFKDSVSNVAMEVAEAFVTGFTIAEFAVKNFSDSLRVMVDGITLLIVSMSQEIPFRFQEMAIQMSWLVENIGAITAVVAMGKTTFAEAFQDMPTLGQREITKLEESLANSINERSIGLVDEFARTLNERIAGLRREFQVPFNVDLERSKRPQAGTGLQNQLRDLQAFESRILTRGPAQSPVDKIAENTAKMVEAQKETTKAIEGIDISPSTNVNLEEIR